MTKQKFKVNGMHCVGCAMIVDDKIEGLSGVISASTSYARQLVEVEYDEREVTVASIAEVIHKSGYVLEPPQAHNILPAPSR